MIDAPSGGAPKQAGIRLLAPYLIVWGYVGIYRRKEYAGGATGGPQAWGARLGGRRAPLPRGFLEASLTQGPCLLDHVRSKNHAPEGFIPFGLRLIFFFCETLKLAKNSNSGLGLWLIG